MDQSNLMSMFSVQIGKHGAKSLIFIPFPVHGTVGGELENVISRVGAELRHDKWTNGSFA